MSISTAATSPSVTANLRTNAPAASESASAAPAAAPQTAPAQDAPAAAPSDSVKVSSEAGGSEAPKNPYEGVSDNFSTVTVDPWKKGKNDTVEGMLRNQGYSLQDIYNKDKNGKTLIDHVAAANKLKNPNLIRDGAELKVPSRANSESMSSQDLKNGESQNTSVSNEKASITTDSEMTKNDDGSTDLSVGVNNSENRDTNLSTGTSVGEGGRIDTSSTAVEKGVETNTVAMNKNGSAVTQERTEATPEQTTHQMKDIDKTGDNMNVQANNNEVLVNNPGTGKAGDVKSRVDISERSSDGFLENGARGVAEFFGFGGEAKQSAQMDGASEVNVSKNSEGQATVSGTRDGEQQQLLQTAGDTDDTKFERAGEWGDDRVQDVKEFGSAALETASDTVGAVTDGAKKMGKATVDTVSGWLKNIAG